MSNKVKVESKSPKTWDEVLRIADEQFPKGRCKERGQLLVVLAYAKIYLNSVLSKFKGFPALYESFEEYQKAWEALDDERKHTIKVQQDTIRLLKKRLNEA